jgi:hypothetical protein
MGARARLSAPHVGKCNAWGSGSLARAWCQSVCGGAYGTAGAASAGEGWGPAEGAEQGGML